MAAVERARFVLIDGARAKPWHQSGAENELAPGAPRVAPRTNRGAPQCRDVRPAAEATAQVAHERAHVESAADNQVQPARAGQVVRDPAGLVKIDAHGRKVDGFASMRPRVRALAADALVAGRRRNLF